MLRLSGFLVIGVLVTFESQAAVIDYHHTLIFEREEFEMSMVEECVPDPEGGCNWEETDLGYISRDENVYGFEGFFSYLDVGEEVEFSFSIDEQGQGDAYLLECNFGGTSCIGHARDMVQLPDLDGNWSTFTYDGGYQFGGSDFFIEADLKPGGVVSLSSLYSGERYPGIITDDYITEYRDYYAYFIVKPPLCNDHEAPPTVTGIPPKCTPPGLAAVPVPASLPLLIAGFGGLIFVHRNRRIRK